MRVSLRDSPARVEISLSGVGGPLNAPCKIRCQRRSVYSVMYWPSAGCSMSLMPCFDRDHAFEEGIVIGRLLAGYGEIELQMCMCLIVVEGILDVPIRTIFGKRGAEERIKIGKRELEPDFGKASLLADLTEATADLDWCRQIRNQYSHCQWYWTAQEGLCFVNLEELAKQPTQILSVMGQRHPVDVPLLQRQEDFFWYVKQRFMHLETAYRAWDQAQARGGAAGPPSFVYPKPPKIPRPPAHN